MKTVGIPRGLFFYYYYPLWKTFFTYLGVQVLVSPPTNKRIIDAGILAAVDEACFPVKVYYGHVKELCRQGVDYLFVPRLVSVEERSYICPKFMGIPDMLRAQVPDLPPLIDIKIDLSRDDRELKKNLHEVGRIFDAGPRRVAAAYTAAREELRCFKHIAALGYTLDEAVRAWEGGEEESGGEGGQKPPGRSEETGTGDESRRPTPALTVGVLGHGYSLYDQVISLNLIRRLREMGVRVVTPEMVNAAEIEAHAATLPKRMFWTLGKKMIGSGLQMEQDARIDGIIYLACFGCGPDSLVGQIIEHRVKRTPFMLVTVDEHTGEAGIVTRLEAFCDMIRRRKQLHEGNLPAYG